MTYHGQVGVHSIELEVDLLVQSCLALSVKVLLHVAGFG